MLYSLRGRPRASASGLPPDAVVNAGDGVGQRRHRVLFVVPLLDGVDAASPESPSTLPVYPAPLSRRVDAILFANLRTDPRMPENPHAPLRGLRRRTSACVCDAEGYNTASRPARERRVTRGGLARPRDDGGREARAHDI